jgi:hypothetical protein
MVQYLCRAAPDLSRGVRAPRSRVAWIGALRWDSLFDQTTPTARLKTGAILRNGNYRQGRDKFFALPSSLRGLRLLFHRNGLFAFPASEVIEFRAPDIALAFNFDFGDSGRM